MVAAAMNNDGGTLVLLAGYFAMMSLLAIGGGNAAVPDMHRLVVEVMHWMSDRQFADMFAIAQVTPGPNVLIVTMIGYHVAGLAGALVTTLAMCGPSCAFAYVMGKVWERFKQARWRVVIQAGMFPISIGLIGATAVVVTRATAASIGAVALIVVTAAITFKLRLNPLWIFAAAALLGLAGVI
jgi:chromate transporter